MKRRSFVKTLFGALVGGLAAPQLTAATAEPIVVIDPAAPFYPPSDTAWIADNFYQTSPFADYLRQHAESATPGDWVS